MPPDTNRWRESGTNWEGRSWRLSHAVWMLLVEVEAAFPNRGPADGTVASKTHDQNNPTSDHRPHPYTGPGVVRAADIGEYVEDQGIAICEAIRSKRPRWVKYVIHENRMFSSYPTSSVPAWTWRSYSGGNGHLDHVHVSVYAGGDNDATPWNLGLGGSPITGGTNMLCKKGDKGDHVGAWQERILLTHPNALPNFGADNDFGDETVAGTKQLQATLGVPQTGACDAKTFAAAYAIPGAKGPKGDTGAKGAKGDPGPKGDKGDRGAQGIAGIDGRDGAPGTLTIKGSVNLP